MNRNQQDKKLRHKLSLMRSEGRTDYKLQRSRAMDVFAAFASVALAVLYWVTAAQI